jgi:hypothetical protein
VYNGGLYICGGSGFALISGEPGPPMDINALTEDTTPSVDNDFLATYDASAAGLKKVKLVNLGFSPLSHTHAQSEITDLETALADKAAVVHGHNASDITTGTLSYGRLGNQGTSGSRKALIFDANGTDWGFRGLDATDILSGSFSDSRISQSSVTQHQAALAIAGTQITSGEIPPARLPVAAVADKGAVLSKVCPAGEVFTGIVDGVFTCTADATGAAPAGGVENDIIRQKADGSSEWIGFDGDGQCTYIDKTVTPWETTILPTAVCSFVGVVLTPGTAPASPVNGQMWYDSSLLKFRVKENDTIYDMRSGGSGGLADPGGDGLVKRTAENVTEPAVAGTDYYAPGGAIAASDLPDTNMSIAVAMVLGITTGNQPFVAGTAKCTAFTPQAKLVVNTFARRITVVGAASTVIRYAIYRGSDRVLIAQTGAVAADTETYAEVSLGGDYTLQGGTPYFFCAVSDGTPSILGTGSSTASTELFRPLNGVNPSVSFAANAVTGFVDTPTFTNIASSAPVLVALYR